MIWSSVVLPQPLGPTRPTVSPGEIAKLYPSLWLDEEAEGSKNRHEEELLRIQLKRLGIEPDELELISGKIAQWNDGISKKLSLDAN